MRITKTTLLVFALNLRVKRFLSVGTNERITHVKAQKYISLTEICLGYETPFGPLGHFPQRGQQGKSSPKQIS